MLNETKENGPIDDYETYISDMQDEFLNQKENCSSLYMDIKTMISTIEKENPEIDINLFSDFFQIIEEYYSLFSNVSEVLTHFSFLNNQCLNQDKLIKDQEKEIIDLKKENETLNQDTVFKEANIAKLEEEVQLLTKDYINLYNTANTTSRSEENELTPSQEEEKKALTNRIQKLKDEKAALNKEITNLKNTVYLLEVETKTKYISKEEHDKQIKVIKKENKNNLQIISDHENTITQLKKEIANLCNINDELTAELDDKQNEIEKLKSEQYNTEQTHVINMPSTLDNLLLGNNEENENKDEGAILTDRTNSENDNNSQNLKNINLNITSSDVIKEMANNNFKKLKEKDKINTQTSRIKSIYKIINNPLEKKISIMNTRRVPNDYYKQFFFLTYQSIKLNSDYIEPFLSVNPEVLYKECKNEHIPFHKFETWLNKNIFSQGKIESRKQKTTNEYGNFLGFISSKLI